MVSCIQSAKYSRDIGHLSSHFHDCHQFLYIEEGQICITIGDRVYHAGPGCLILINRFESHSIRIESTEYRRYTVRIRPEFSGYEDRLFSILVNRPENFCHVLDTANDPDIPMILKQIVTEWSERQELWEKQLECCIYSLLICLYRHYPILQQTKSETLTLIQAVRAQLEENYSLPVTLENLAQQYHISPSHLSHTFKKVTGQSVIGYLNACRFAAAKRLLCETDMDISNIVSACGFSDSSNFSRSFRNMTGMTPSQFRIANKH